MRDRQRLFVLEYLNDWNATQAAIRAGYSKKTARQIGSENLSKPVIQAAIQAEIAERAMGPSEVLQRLGDMARGDIGELMEIRATGFELDLMAAKDANKTKLIKRVKQRVTTYNGKGPNDMDREVIETEVELYDAQAALVQLGRHHGLFTDTLKLEGSLNVTNLQQVLDTAYGSDNAGSGDNDQGE